jgi:hypothetical protein
LLLICSARPAVAAYEACAVDVYRAFRGSWFIGSILLVYYLVAFVIGLIVGAFLFDLASPLLDAIVLPLSGTASTVIEFCFLFLLLYIGTSGACILARALVQGITYLCFEMREHALFYLVLLAAFGSILTLSISALAPLIISEETLITIAGLSATLAAISMIFVGWLYVRYRWPLNPRKRIFDHDIGLAWSHMSDPNRTRFGFGSKA